MSNNQAIVVQVLPFTESNHPLNLNLSNSSIISVNVSFRTNFQHKLFQKFRKESQHLSILHTIRKHFTILGIFYVSKQDLPSQLRECHAFINIVQICFVMASLLSYAAAVICFLLFKAKTFYEYSEAALFSAASFLLMAFYLVVMSKRYKLTNLMNDLEKVIIESNYTIFDIFHSFNFRYFLKKYSKCLHNFTILTFSFN